jgi:alanine racemase
MSTREPEFPLTRAEIDLEALAHNCRLLRERISPGAKLMAVVKADAYGHGLVPVSRVCVENGASFLGVACLTEAIRLRQAGIEAPILLFGYSPGRYAGHLARYDIRASVHSLAAARALSTEAALIRKRITVHIKIDTGMGRLGLPAYAATLGPRPRARMREVVSEAAAIARLPWLFVEGIYTHFSCADDPDTSRTESQLALFMEILDELERRSIEFELRHAANSAATLRMPSTHLDMVRPGISLYGLSPAEGVGREACGLRPVMSVKSAVIQVREVPAGFRVSYGGRWQSSKPTRIAVVPIGYADGYKRSLSSNAEMLVGGKRAPVVGTVCMDLTMIEVGDLPSVAVEDEVVVLGSQGGEEITAEEIARRIGTIHYEVVSSLTARIPRLYMPCPEHP